MRTSSSDLFKPGDRVVSLHADTFSSYQTVAASMLHKLEDGHDLSYRITLSEVSFLRRHGAEGKLMFPLKPTKYACNGNLSYL